MTDPTDPQVLADAFVAAASALVAADMSLSLVIAEAIGAARAKYPAAPGAGPEDPPTAKHNPPTL